MKILQSPRRSQNVPVPEKSQISQTSDQILEPYPVWKYFLSSEDVGGENEHLATVHHL